MLILSETARWITGANFVLKEKVLFSFFVFFTQFEAHRACKQSHVVLNVGHLSDRFLVTSFIVGNILQELENSNPSACPQAYNKLMDDCGGPFLTVIGKVVLHLKSLKHSPHVRLKGG